MRTYRVEMTGEVITFAVYVKAANEHEAMQQARRENPGFMISKIVEVF